MSRADMTYQKYLEALKRDDSRGAILDLSPEDHSDKMVKTIVDYVVRTCDAVADDRSNYYTFSWLRDSDYISIIFENGGLSEIGKKVIDILTKELGYKVDIGKRIARNPWFKVSCGQEVSKTEESKEGRE